MSLEALERWSTRSFWDDEPTKNQYGWPLSVEPQEAKTIGDLLAHDISSERVYMLGGYVCTTSPESHRGPYRHAVDFLVLDGTPVFAALDGRVVEVYEHSSTWGPTPDFVEDLNYLTLAHVNGEYSQYCHLAKSSVRASGLCVGMNVQKGQPIALVGKTGWTDRDHLHFIVFRGFNNESPFKFKSLKVQFE